LVHKTRVLFVCLGNIVRSPLAENIFRQLVQQAGLQELYEIDSAGTGSWHVGESPDGRMVRVAARHGLQYSGRARQVRRADLDEFDWLIAMDRDNRAVLYSMAHSPTQQAKIRLLREFDPEGNPHAEVPDPYYGGADGFEATYQIVERSCRLLLDVLEKNREQI
jgi:protein-tyrosine phosphatase